MNKHRIIRDIEALGGGFIREEVIKKTPISNIVKGTLYTKRGTSSIVAVQFHGSYGELLGPMAAGKENVESYKEIMRELLIAEADTSTGYRRQLIIRNWIDEMEKITSAVIVGIFSIRPIETILTDTVSIVTFLGPVICGFELIMIKKLFLELRKRQ